jgi:hypothetical protein
MTKPRPQGSDVSMGIPIQDLHGSTASDIAQEVAVTRFVATSEDDHNRFFFKKTLYGCTKLSLSCLQIPITNFKVSYINRVLKQTLEPTSFFLIKRKSIEVLTDDIRRKGCTYSAAIPSHTFITRKPDNYSAGCFIPQFTAY